MYRLTFVAVGVVAALSGVASAGIKWVDVAPVDIANLTLPVDNVWNGSYGAKSDFHVPGKDFGYTTTDSGDYSNVVWIKETWTETHSPSAVLDANIFNEGRADPVITINKAVDNFTANAWTGFDITLSTASGNVGLIGSPTSSAFANAQVFNNNTNAVLMHFDAGTVNPGNSAVFNFTFTVPFSGLWTFTITQTPVPTPGAAALMTMAGLITLRRKRAA